MAKGMVLWGIGSALLLSGCARLEAAMKPRVVLVDDGKARCVLVLPEDATEDEVLAANELQTHLEKMSGAKPDIVRGAVPEGVVPVRIGLGLSPDTEAVIRGTGDDPASYILDSTDSTICIAGLSPEGTLFAAYELLEQLGCRWYLPGDLGTVVPKKRTVALRAGRTIRVPSFPHRHLQAISRQLPWYRRQRLGGLYFPGAHGIRLQPKADLEKDAELFALVGGKRVKRQLCLSNPEVLKRAIAATLQYIEKNPDKEYFGMGPNDGAGFCECEGCRELDGGEWDPFAAETSMTDRYVWFFNRVLEAVHQMHPGKKLCFYSYHSYKLTPKKWPVDPHIVPAFAPITLCRIHGMSNPICPDRSFYAHLMKSWGEIVPALFERGYYFNLACPGFPWSKVHAVRDEIPKAFEYGVKGWRVECVSSWAPNGLTHYMAARLMWDVQTDVDALLAEFYNTFFGPAAGPMGAYLDSLDATIRDSDVHSGSSYCMLQFFDGAWMARGKALLDEAASKAGAGTYGQRVRIYRLNYDMLEAFLEMIQARNEFDFARARDAREQIDEIIELMIHFRLYPNPSIEEPITAESRKKRFRARNGEARLLYARPARSYMKRFWVDATETGYERTVTRGELVAGTPDEWDFLIDPFDVGEVTGWYRDGAIGGSWQPIKTKSATWSDQGLHYYKGVAWYRTTVNIPDSFAGRNVLLWFGGVDEKAKVWLNGTLLGVSEEKPFGLPGEAGAFRPFELDATSAIRFGAANALAVRIENHHVNEIGTGGIVAPVMFWSPKSK